MVQVFLFIWLIIGGRLTITRQFGMAATAHATVFGLGLVSATLSGGDGGWKEI